MPKLCLPHVALTQRQQHKRLCWYFFVFYDCLPQLFRHRYWRRRSAACGCNCDCGRETRTQTVAATVQVTRTATGWCCCCCCLYGFCTSFILEGGLAAVPFTVPVAIAAAPQLTPANGNGVNVATVVAATVPATTAATATATVAATAAANERELNLGDLTLSIYLGHGCCLLSCVWCSVGGEGAEGRTI